MICTSYFANIKNLPENFIPISICAKPPVNYKGLEYKLLAPSYDILMTYKQDGNIENYIKKYKNILSKYNQETILKNITQLLPRNLKEKLKEDNSSVISSKNVNIVLICFEKPNDFCHRHLIADWFNEYFKEDLVTEFKQKELIISDEER